MSRGGVMVNSKAETDTSLIHAPALCFTSRVNIDPQLHEYLGTAAAGPTTVAVLCDLCTSRRRNNRRGSRDIE